MSAFTKPHMLAILVNFLLVSLVRSANILLEGGTVLWFNSEDKQVEPLFNASVLIRGAQISRIFSASDNVSVPYGTERISVVGKIVSPGFIDTHRHLWQTQFRTIGSNTSLAEYFNRYGEFTQVQTVYTPDDVYLGQFTGIYESLNAGVTSILDHAHHTWSTNTSSAGLQASIDSGARVFWCPAIHNLTNGYSRNQQLADVTAFLKRDLSGSPTTVGLAYDSFFNDPPSEVQRVVDILKSNNVSVLTTHALGGVWAYNNGPTTLNQFGILNTSLPIVFSHGSYFSTDDAILLRSTNQYLSITPESEHHYGHGDPVSHLIQDQAAIGVDTHFTYSTDIVTQARFWLQVARLRYYVQTLDDWQVPRNNPESARQAYHLATRAGGLSVRRPDLGVITEGAKADLVVFDGDSPNMLGWADPIAAIMLHSNVGDVRHVLVDGEFRKRDGKLILPNNGSWSDVQQRFLASAKRIQQIWAETPLPSLEGPEFRPGVPYADAVTADTLRGPGTGY